MRRHLESRRGEGVALGRGVYANASSGDLSRSLVPPVATVLRARARRRRSARLVRASAAAGDAGAVRGRVIRSNSNDDAALTNDP